MTTIRLTPGRTNVTRAEFIVTLRRMHAAKWGRRARAAVVLPPPSPAPEPEPEPEERRLTADEAAEAVRLRQTRASHWTWKRLGERYGVDPYAVKLALMGVKGV